MFNNPAFIYIDRPGWSASSVIYVGTLYMTVPSVPSIIRKETLWIIRNQAGTSGQTIPSKVTITQKSLTYSRWSLTGNTWIASSLSPIVSAA
ncbi:hypothetical protein FRB91_003415 [Serendipita sp. 411]|nr:hypothetical protein FRB91_003415 [Serendipita sp. 411]